MRIIICYDNDIVKNEMVQDIIGTKTFAEVVIGRRRVEETVLGLLQTCFPGAIIKRIDAATQYETVEEQLKPFVGEDVRVLHLFSNWFVTDEKKALLSFQKLNYIDSPWKMCADKQLVGMMFPDVKTYLPFCKNRLAGVTSSDAVNYINQEFPIEGVSNLAQVSRLVACLTGNFEARYFNTLTETKYTLTKSSTDKDKLKKEYTFYHLLPDEMKPWFVLPYNYREDKDTASYTMERLYMTDLAIKWVHGSIEPEEFETILDMYFHFFSVRSRRMCSAQVYQKTADALYVDKVKERTTQLKAHPAYTKLSPFLEAGHVRLDELVNAYFDLKKQMEKNLRAPNCQVIGHGDPGFANALYHKSTRTLKFIDPKGALTEEEMWTNPYYDLAKLSHCICGRYDFFNSGLFDIKLGEQLKFELDIPFDNAPYRALFQQKVEQNGFDYLAVRVYEISLFLSLLPLHMDNPYKVFGFILNIQNLLNEVKQYV